MKKQRCRDFDEKGICRMAEFCPYDHGEVVIAPADSEPTNNEAQLIPQNFTQQNQAPVYNQMYQQNRPANLKPRRNLNKPGLLPIPPGMNPQQQRFPNKQQNFNQRNMAPQNQQPLQQQQQTGQTNEMFAQQQRQQQQTGMSRPRNLVNIITSVNNEEEQSIDMQNQTGFIHQQRGMKRTCKSK